jgi:DNA-directed RNA polymerase subunit omega
MARVTIEDCLEHVSDHFALVHLATKRFRQLQQPADPSKPPQFLVESDNKFAVTALREIAAGKVNFRENVSEHMHVYAEQAKLKHVADRTDFEAGE